MSAVLVSCTKSEVTNPNANASISISPTELNFDATGGDKTVTITSTGEWSVAYTSDDWFELSATSGQNGDKITISADPYDNTEDERYGYIDFSCGNSSTSVSITQSAKEHSVTVNPEELTFGAEGGTKNVTVTSTGDWTMDGYCNWCEVSASRGVNGDKITFTVSKFNSTNKENKYTYTFFCGGKETEFTVTQEIDNSPIVHFKDAEFEKEIIIMADLNVDNQLSQAEVAFVKELDLSERDLIDLEDIKYFTGLLSLDCSDNQLTTLDISNNIALEELICDNNSLTSLDVSKNTALTSLYCSNNQLTFLDVSKNTALTSLDCDKNQLASIDLSSNTALRGFYCRENNLTSLDVSKNTALTSLYCSNNQLTSLNLSHCVYLWDLLCENNQLTSLNVVGCRLGYFNCSNNRLTVLDLRGNFQNSGSQNIIYSYDNPIERVVLSRHNYIIETWIESYKDIITYVD